MHRIDTPTAQKDKFGAGKNGFTRGNPQTGTPATDLDDDYFDMLQEELAGVVEATGVVLDKSKHNQLLTALKSLLLSRVHPFADIKADGSAAVAEALSNLGLVTNGNVGRLINIQTPSVSGTYTPTDGARFVIVRLQAAGGNGANAAATANGQV
ncbi:TPA: carbohydrate kinase, partial [Enterobacter roggenkampii]